MNPDLQAIKQEFIEGLSGISAFWGFPKGMGALFAVLYLSPSELSLDELVEQSGLTKGAVSTNMRALARLGLVHRLTRLGDRKDYYQAETNFYKAVQSILKERQNSEFDRAIASVQETLSKLEAGAGSSDPEEQAFLIERVQALQSFFGALDKLFSAVARLDSLGFSTIQTILNILK